jgi:protein TonB
MRYLICFLLCVGSGVGEVAAQQVIPPLKKQFLDSAWHVLPSAAGARYRRETEWRDSTAGVVRDYYLSGQLQSQEALENIRTHRSHGVSEYFFEDGHLKTHREFTHGETSGEHRWYYPSGQLKRREHYAAGQRLDGECFAASGAAVPYYEYYIMPVYSEGNGSPRAVSAAIGRRFTYPEDARRAGIQGQVVLTFYVNSQGRVEDAKVIEGLCPSVNAEAVQAVSRLRPFKAALVDGEPVRFYFKVPITLKI